MKVAKSIVDHAVKIFKEFGTCEDHLRSGKPSTAWSKKMIKAVQEKVRRNLKRSARQMAKDMNVTSMRRIIKNDLKLLPYKMIKRQYLTSFKKQKKKRDKANILLRDLKLARQREKLFFFLMKNSSQLNLMLTIRMTVCMQNLQQSLMRPQKQSTDNKIRFQTWFVSQSPNFGSHFWFSWNKELRLTQISTLIIF